MRNIFQSFFENIVFNTKIDFVFPTSTPLHRAIMFLGLVIILDFVTGVAAGWIQFKKTENKTVEEKKYFIESAKLRLTVVKFIFYSIGILSARGIEVVLLLREIPSGQISTKNLTLTVVIIGLFSLIEIYSILFENINQMGFDIIQKTKNISTAFWKLYNTIKNGSNIN